eukprot:m.387445 g.387445  ORF g.387445 m.387445 type:complete len:69 (-) comp162027_c0_seq1:3-209(-)
MLAWITHSLLQLHLFHWLDFCNAPCYVRYRLFCSLQHPWYDPANSFDHTFSLHQFTPTELTLTPWVLQ